MKINFKTCLKLGLTFLLVYICIYFLPQATTFVGTVFGAATPLFIGGAIAYIINIILGFYEKIYFPKSNKRLVIKSRRGVCLLASVLSVLAIISLIIGLILPQLISCVQLLLTKIPAAIKGVVTTLNGWNIIPDNAAEYISQFDFSSKLGQIVSTIGNGIGNVMETLISTVSSVFSGVVTAVLSVIFSIYILSSKEKLSYQFDKLFKLSFSKKWYDRIKYVIGVFNDSFRNYIIGQCTEAIILGTLCAVGMLIMGLPYAAMIGTLVAFMALIPVAGAYIATVVGALMIFTESPVKALIFIIFIVALQQIEGNIIYPKVVGNSIGLPGIWVLAAVTVGGGIFGIFGMVIGVPVAAGMYRIIKDNAQKIPENKRDIKL